jgi:hypothetical protein
LTDSLFDFILAPRTPKVLPHYSIVPVNPSGKNTYPCRRYVPIKRNIRVDATKKEIVKSLELSCLRQEGFFISEQRNFKNHAVGDYMSLRQVGTSYAGLKRKKKTE